MAKDNPQPGEPDRTGTFRHVAPREGLVLNKLKLSRALGAGHEGRVWKAEHTDSRLPYAVKFLAPELCQNPTAVEHFCRTFRAVKERLHNQHHMSRMGGLTESSDHGSWYWMEYVNHVNLRDFLQEQAAAGRPLSPLQVCELLLPIAQVLDVAHSRNLLHCDINPRHLMVELRNNGQMLVKLIDFGEAILLDERPHNQPNDCWPAGGTPGYISPERRQGRPQCGRSDQYSLAIVVGELLLGFQPKPEFTPAAIIDAVSRLAVDPDLRPILVRGLHPESDGRYGSCAEFLSAVRTAVSADQPLGGSILQTYTGLQKQKRGAVADPPPFWTLPDFLPPKRTDDPRRDSQQLQQRAKRLQTAKQELQQRLERLQKEPVKVGIVGTRNAGKSSLFAVWTLFRNSPIDGVDLVISEEQTASYLKSLAKELLEEGIIRPNTYLQPPQYLKLDVTVHNEPWELLTCDFTGEFLNSETNSEYPEASGTLEFLRQADMIIFLYDPAEKDALILDHIDKLFRDIPPELVLALTKIDQHWESVADMTRFPRFYQKLCQKLPVLQQVDSKLTISFARHGLKVIPISSFGRRIQPVIPKNRMGPQLQVHDLSPYQIFSPLAAAFQRRADDVRHLRLQLERLNQIEETLTKRLTSANDAATARQDHVSMLINELELTRASIRDALAQPADPGVRETLNKHHERLAMLRKTLHELNADQEMRQCVHLIGELKVAIADFPARLRRAVIQNGMKLLTEANQLPYWVFLTQWFLVQQTVSKLQQEVTAGVEDPVRLQFNQQYSQLMLRNIRLAGTIIGCFVLFFLVLLSF